MTELAHFSTDYAVVEDEPPEVMGRNLRVAAHLWASATVFFFFAFLFAYFYLRSVNPHGLWHPHAVKAPVALGTLIMASVVASAALSLFAAARLRGDDQSAWRLAGLGALALGLLAGVLQIVQFATIGFGPTDGGYASVFFGWTGLYLLFLFCTLYWLETLLATSFRYRGQGARGTSRATPPVTRSARATTSRARSRSSRPAQTRSRSTGLCSPASASPPGSFSTSSRDERPAARVELAARVAARRSGRSLRSSICTAVV